ncbi:MAG TPA: hypothetical protein VIK56_14840 [Rhodoferax sp.]
MHTVEEFLAHTIQLESEAALRFGQLADAEHVAELQRWMQLHLSGDKLPTEG